MSNRSPDQDKIDALLRELDAEKKQRSNGSANGVPNGSTNGLIHKAPAASMPDDRVIEMCRRAKNAAKFVDLFEDGNIAPYEDDESDADFALIGILQHHTHDIDQLERLMRASALSRPKYNDMREGKPWIRYSIERNLADKAAPISPPSAEYLRAHRDDSQTGSGSGSSYSNGTGTGERRRLTSTAFADMPPPKPREYLVEGIVPASYPAMIYGDGGVAKSMLALSLGLAVASGAEAWLGHRIKVSGGVMYLDFELDADEQRRRVSQLVNAEGLGSPPLNLRYMSAVGVRAGDAFEDALIECKEHDIRLLIIDSLGPALEGDAEASRDVIAFYNRRMDPIRAAGVAPLVIDHQAKTQRGERYQEKRAFGSVFKGNLARSVIQVEAKDHEDGSLKVRLRHNKHNFGAKLQPFGAHLTFTEESVRVAAFELEESDLAEEDTVNAKERVYMALKGFEDEQGTRDDIVEATGLAAGTVKKEIAALKKEPARVWDTGHLRERQPIVTTKEPTGSGSTTYKGTGTGTGGPDPGQSPLTEEF